MEGWIVAVVFEGLFQYWECLAAHSTFDGAWANTAAAPSVPDSNAVCAKSRRQLRRPGSWLGPFPMWLSVSGVGLQRLLVHADGGFTVVLGQESFAALHMTSVAATPLSEDDENQKYTKAGVDHGPTIACQALAIQYGLPSNCALICFTSSGCRGMVRADRSLGRLV